jgi:hypothetical protein
LFEGSLEDNNQDMVTKGRHCKNGVGMPQDRGLVPRGMDHWNAKVTPEQAAEIRERIAGGDTGRALAKEYGTSEAVVSLIRNNKWRVSCRKHQKPL